MYLLYISNVSSIPKQKYIIFAYFSQQMPAFVYCNVSKLDWDLIAKYCSFDFSQCIFDKYDRILVSFFFFSWICKKTK